MKQQTEKYARLAQKHRDEILAAEAFIWAHPETGFKEWQTGAYMEQVFEKAGYSLCKAGNIPGFYTDIDTGRPGPKLMILCELDALAMPDHFAAVDGCAHACGHHAQCAAMVGIALALREEGALDGLSGSIRLAVVPAEEEIQLDFRDELRRDGIIRYCGGKDEFLWRGYFDGVDLAYMFHTGTNPHSRMDIHDGCNGNISKDVRFIGKGAHAGSFPQAGINALYAATLALNAINALRETFPDRESVRVHPILTKGGDSVSVIPAETAMSTLVRGNSLPSIARTARKVDRAIASGALAMGARVIVTDHPGAAPLHNSARLKEIAVEAMGDLLGRENLNITHNWGGGSTDMGNLSCLMPVLHPYISGAAGASHGNDFRIADPENACVSSAAGQLVLAAVLLSDGAKLAREVVDSYEPLYPDKAAYFADWDRFMAERELVAYDENGNVAVTLG